MTMVVAKYWAGRRRNTKDSKRMETIKQVPVALRGENITPRFVSGSQNVGRNPIVGRQGITGGARGEMQIFVF